MHLRQAYNKRRFQAHGLEGLQNIKYSGYGWQAFI
jgi:hypothetical protein